MLARTRSWVLGKMAAGRIEAWITHLETFSHDSSSFAGVCEASTAPSRPEPFLLLIIIPTFLLRSDSAFSAALFSSNLSVLSRCSRIFSSALCLSQKTLCQITHAEASFKIKACTPPSRQSFIWIDFNILVFENSPRIGRLNAKFQFHKFLQNTFDLDIWLFWLLLGGTLRDLVTFDCLVSVIKDTFAD